MAVDVTTQITIRAPVDIGSAYAADLEHAPPWYANIESVEWVTPRPVARGSKVAFVAHFLGRRLEYTYEVVECVPGEHLHMSTSSGPFPMTTEYDWTSDVDGGTRMTVRNRGMPTGFTKVAAPLTVSAMRRANRKDLERLKELLEASESLHAPPFDANW